jgi:hypothetical protein
MVIDSDARKGRVGPHRAVGLGQLSAAGVLEGQLIDYLEALAVRGVVRLAPALRAHSHDDRANEECTESSSLVVDGRTYTGLRALGDHLGQAIGRAEGAGDRASG